MAKPVGPACNLDCTYCFYSEKEQLFSGGPRFKMSDQVLTAYIKKYLGSQDVPEIPFVWQGGEPTLAGLDFYRKAIGLQQKWADGRRITNALQTNGVLLDDRWCYFLKSSGFSVGLSLDGPESVHDRYRIDKAGRPTHARVLRSLALLQKYDVPYNVLATVTQESAADPVGLYRFLKEQGVQFIQFTPVVERQPDEEAAALRLKNAAPPRGVSRSLAADVTPWSVGSEAYGDFLIEIFDEWVRTDVGSIYVMNFEWALTAWLGLPSTVCIFGDKCGGALVLEYNGDIYSCDHYVYPRYRVGNVLTDDLAEVVRSDMQLEFGSAKLDSLPQYCIDCDVRFACNGECPRHRFLLTPDGEPGLSYLCAGYAKFFRHIDRYMKVMRELVINGLPASKVMDAIKGPLLIIKE